MKRFTFSHEKIQEGIDRFVDRFYDMFRHRTWTGWAPSNRSELNGKCWDLVRSMIDNKLVQISTGGITIRIAEPHWDNITEATLNFSFGEIEVLQDNQRIYNFYYGEEDLPF